MKRVAFMSAVATLSLAVSVHPAGAAQQRDGEATEKPIVSAELVQVSRPPPSTAASEEETAEEADCIERSMFNRLRSPLGYLRYQAAAILGLNDHPRRQFCRD
jgi:hypothetical protein